MMPGGGVAAADREAEVAPGMRTNREGARSDRWTSCVAGPFMVLIVAGMLVAAPPGKRSAKQAVEDQPAIHEGGASSSNAESSADPQEFERLPPDCEWEVLFTDGISPLEYARQIDYFGIELAAVAKNGQIQYASHVTQPKPERRVGKKSEELRIAINWKQGNLSSLDGKLLTKAGITTTDKTITHYYPLAIEAKMMQVQKAYAGRQASDIRRTRFKIRPQENNPKAYEFYVDEQDVREASPSAVGGRSSIAK